GDSLTGGVPPVLRRRPPTERLTTRLSLFSVPGRRVPSTYNVRGGYQGGVLHLCGPTPWRATVLGGCAGARRCSPSTSVRFSPSSPCGTIMLNLAHRERPSCPVHGPADPAR